MIEIIAALIALTVLTFGYVVSRNFKTENTCKVWVQENRSSDWLCVDRLK